MDSLSINACTFSQEEVEWGKGIESLLNHWGCRMKVSHYWAKEEKSAESQEGYRYDLRCWGGSNVSVEDAQRVAHERLTGVIERLKQGLDFEDYGGYQGEIREVLLEEIFNDNGDVIGAITRNRYGALVLNVPDTFIADIDIPRSSPWRNLLVLLSLAKKKDKEDYIQAVKAFAFARPHLGIRLYETHSGLRVFITSHQMEPSDSMAKDFLNVLKSDPLYQRLCFSQQCYRARLTPKPWRCACPRPASTLPGMSDAEWETFQRWLAMYEEKTCDYAVCRLIESWGPDSMSDATARVIKVHDQYALAKGKAALA